MTDPRFDLQNAYPIQLQVIAKTIDLLKEKGSAFIRAGQRSGKTYMAGVIYDHIKPKKFIGISTTETYAKSNFGMFVDKDMDNMFLGHASGQVKAILTPDFDPDNWKFLKGALVAIDEATWLPDHVDVIKLVSNFVEAGAKVVVISSDGPNPSLQNVANWDLRYATWDIIPTEPFVAPEWVHFFKEDWDKSARDFGLYDSHNSNAITYFETLK